MPNLIPVRSKLTGDVTTVNEKAFGAFAAHYDRLDQPAEADPPGEAEPPKKQRSRGTAAPEAKE
ncbi:hypothetical protein ACIBEJ_48680 [Nonomuraea sp. NPDC050790]|uniref:hypothetical protein n=1 Tax=Nonomuraea sp. NPDC050790 TaxID=3364371 RepID=UPI003793F7AE